MALTSGAVYDRTVAMTLTSGDQLRNPANLSAELAAMFPPGVIVAQLTDPPVLELLTEEERASVSHCASKRIRDFAAGRLCARRALEEIGIHDFSLLSAADRQPIWPPAVIGSITHTEGFCAAVVARPGPLVGLGIDCEAMDAVHEELWPRICTPDEVLRLESLPSARRILCATLIFAAKEAFYKSQYPLTGEWIGFEEVALESADWERSSGVFQVQAHRDLLLAAQLPGPWTGRFQFRDPFVFAAVALQS